MVCIEIRNVELSKTLNPRLSSNLYQLSFLHAKLITSQDGMIVLNTKFIKVCQDLRRDGMSKQNIKITDWLREILETSDVNRSFDGGDK